MKIRRWALLVVVASSLTVNVVLSLLVWADATLIDQMGVEMEKITTAIHPLVMQQDQAARRADELEGQLNDCRLGQIKRLVGVYPQP